MGENKRLVKFEQAGRDEDLGVKKLREKEGNRKGGNLGLIGSGGLDISAFEVSLGEIGIKMQLRWK